MVYASNGYQHVFEDDGAENYCAVCGENVVDDEGDVCGKCTFEKASDFEYARDYLKSREEQKIGVESWTDFVLNHCFEIQDCIEPELVTELLGQFEADTPIGDFVVGEALRDYLTSDSWNFNQYIKSE